MTISSNVTIYVPLDISAISTVGTFSSDDNLLSTLRTETCTITHSETASPAVSISTKSSTEYDAVCIVDSDYVDSGDAISINYIVYLPADYLGSYRTLGTGLWSKYGWSRDPIVILDAGGTLTGSGISVVWNCLDAAASTTVGRMMFCDKWSPTYNFNYGWSAAIIDNSQTVKSIGGQSWTAKKSKQWQITFDLSAMGTDEALGELAAIAWNLGTDTDCVLALTPNADTADVLTLYGRFAHLPTFTNNNYGLYDTQLVFTESL